MSLNKLLINRYLAIFSIVVALLCYFFNYVNSLSFNFLSFLLLLMSIILLWNNRKNLCFFLLSIFIAYSNYSICMGIYIKKFAPNFLFGQITNPKYYFIGLISLIIFNSIILMINFPVGGKFYTLEKSSYNKLVSIILLCFIALIILLYYLDVKNIYSSSLINTVFEYCIILFLLLFHYSGNNKILFILYTIEVIFFSALVFLQFDRCTALITIFAYLIYHYRKEKNYIKYLPIIFMIIFLLISIGEIRLIENITDYQTIFKNILDKINSEYLTFDTAIWAYFTSIESIWLADLFPLSVRIGHFFELIIYLFFGNIFNSRHLNMLLGELGLFQAGGYVSATYLFYYLGIIGVFIIPSLIVLCFNHVKKLLGKAKKSNFMFLLTIYICSTVPRWYLYGIFTITRGLIIFTIVFFIIEFISKIINGGVKIGR